MRPTLGPDRFADVQPPIARPPTAERRPVTTEHHGRSRVDEYEWLRDKGSAEVTAYLEAENDYTEERTAHLADLRQAIFDEIKARTLETDLSVPTRNRGSLVLRPLLRGEGVRRQLPGAGAPTRTTGRRRGPTRTARPDQPRAARRGGAARPRRARRGARVLLPRRVERQPRRHAARLLDRRGRRRALHDPGQGPRHRRAADDEVVGVIGGATWDRAGETFYYTTVDESWRSDKVWRHRLGTDPGRRRAGPPRDRRAVLRRRRPDPQRPLPGRRQRVQDHLGVPVPRRRRPRATGSGSSPSGARVSSTRSTTR